MNKTLALILAFVIPVGLALAASNPAFILTDPSDGHSTGTIDGTTDELDMVGGFKEGGSSTLSNSINGNAATATALAVDPTTCASGVWVQDIAANGTLSCVSVLLDDLGNPSASKTFSMATKALKYIFTATTADGALEIEATGAFTGDVVHIHQHTGNPGVTDLMTLEAEDPDVTPLRIIATAGAPAIVANSSITAPGFFGQLTGKADTADTADALAANGGNCSAGQAPLGVDTAGAVENCFDVQTGAEQTTHEANATVHHIATVSGDITHDSTSGGTTDDAHFDHADDLAELNGQIGSGLVTGAHTTDTNAQTECGTGEYLDGDGGCNVLAVAGAGWYMIAYASGTDVASLPIDAILESSKTYRITGWTQAKSENTGTVYFSSMTFNGDHGANYTWWSQGLNTTSGAGYSIGDQGANSTDNAVALCPGPTNVGAISKANYCHFEFVIRTPPGLPNQVSFWGTHTFNDPANSRWIGPNHQSGNYVGAGNLTSIELGSKGSMLMSAEITLEKYEQSIEF